LTILFLVIIIAIIKYSEVAFRLSMVKVIIG